MVSTYSLRIIEGSWGLRSANRLEKREAQNGVAGAELRQEPQRHELRQETQSLVPRKFAQ